MKLRSGGGAHDTGWLRRGRQEDRTQREEQQEHKVGNRTWSKCVTLSVNGGWWMPPRPPLVSQACWPLWNVHSPELLATNILEPSFIQTPTPTFFSYVTQCICVWVNLGKSLSGVFLQKLFGCLNLKFFFSTAVLFLSPLSMWSKTVSSLAVGSDKEKALLPATPTHLMDSSHWSVPRGPPAQACDIVSGSPALWSENSGQTALCDSSPLFTFAGIVL